MSLSHGFLSILRQEPGLQQLWVALRSGCPITPRLAQEGGQEQGRG